MRIIGEIAHPTLKITVFQMNNKLSVQFESGMYAQIYRIREQAEVRTVADIQKLLDQTFLEAVNDELNRMHRIKNEAFARFLPVEEEDEFEEII